MLITITSIILYHHEYTQTHTHTRTHLPTSIWTQVSVLWCRKLELKSLYKAWDFKECFFSAAEKRTGDFHSPVLRSGQSLSQGPRLGGQSPIRKRHHKLTSCNMHGFRIYNVHLIQRAPGPRIITEMVSRQCGPRALVHCTCRTDFLSVAVFPSSRKPSKPELNESSGKLRSSGGSSAVRRVTDTTGGGWESEESSWDPEAENTVKGTETVQCPMGKGIPLRKTGLVKTG